MVMCFNVRDQKAFARKGATTLIQTLDLVYFMFNQMSRLMGRQRDTRDHVLYQLGRRGMYIGRTSLWRQSRLQPGPTIRIREHGKGWYNMLTTGARSSVDPQRCKVMGNLDQGEMYVVLLDTYGESVIIAAEAASIGYATPLANQLKLGVRAKQVCGQNRQYSVRYQTRDQGYDATETANDVWKTRSSAL